MNPKVITLRLVRMNVAAAEDGRTPLKTEAMKARNSVSGTGEASGQDSFLASGR